MMAHIVFLGYSFYLFLTVIFLVQHEAKIIFAKALFRAGASIMGGNFPIFLLRRIISIVENNPNVNTLKHPSEPPPSLQPTWKLFNHRDPKKAESLQPLLVEKIFKK
jgi:predicted permease